MPHLFSERLRLRAAERSDIPLFLKWINDPQVTENLVHTMPFSSAEEEAWYERMIKLPVEEHVLVMEIKQTDVEDPGKVTWTAIGNIQLMDFDWRIRKAEVGIMIGEKEQWDKGYGTEALQVILEHGFNTMNLNRIWLQVYDKNIRGFTAYKKAGFIEEGRMRQAHYQHGQYYDIIIMSVIREEWKQPDKPRSRN